MIYKSSKRLFGRTICMCAALTMIILLGTSGVPAPASASVTQFCSNVNLKGHGECEGSARNLESVLAWGEQHSVCAGVYPIGVFHGEGTTCSGGPGEATIAKQGACGNSIPVVENNASGSNVVHGETYDCTPHEWHSANLGGTITADPDVCSWGPDHVEVFGRGTDNALWHRTWSGGAWGPWESLGGNLASGVGCVAWGPNRIDVVARAANNTVLHWYWNGSSWQSDNLGGNITWDPDIASWGSGRLDVFGRAPDGSIAHKYFNGSTWSGWETIGAANSVVSGVAAAGSGGNRLDVVGRAPNNEIFQLYYVAGSGWASTLQGGSFEGDPDVSEYGGDFNIWAVGGSNPSSRSLYTKWWQGNKWSPWEGQTTGGGFASSPGSVQFEQNSLDVVGTNSAGNLIYYWWQ